jgi:hypothetical protein
MSIKVTRGQLSTAGVSSAWINEAFGGRGWMTLEDLAPLHPPESARPLFERHGMTGVVYSKNVDLLAPEPDLAPALQEVSERIYGDTSREKIEALRVKHRDLKEKAFVSNELLIAAGIGAMAMIYDQKKEAERHEADFMRSVSSGMIAGWFGQMAFDLMKKKKEGTKG